MRSYSLLPFTFTRLSGKEILVNEVGDMVIAPNGTVAKVVQRQDIDEELYKTLVANFFVSETSIPSLLDIYAQRLAEKKRFLFDFTALHIFVLTLRCNQNCTYCQASSRKENFHQFSMSKKTMKYAVGLMLQSPSHHLTMEFQGGEPSLEPELLQYGIELSKELNTEGKEISYILCTNCFNLTEEILDICKRYKVLISTSLDGPAFIHNKNRGVVDSYERVTSGIEKARAVLGKESVSALMTTSEYALDFPEEIVDEYVRLGFSDIFLRALNPYGLAAENSDWNEYTNKFVEFYKRALEHIIQLNKQGTFFIEDYSAIILKKILSPQNTGFVDLQSPAGIINSVLVYNYDGYVYCSDESRMLAESKDYSFRLGPVTNTYEQLIHGEVAIQCAKVWANEALAGCSDCALRLYCGADPVRNHTTQNDWYGYRPSSLFCKKNKAIIEHLLSLIIERHDEVMPIFKSWLL